MAAPNPFATEAVGLRDAFGRPYIPAVGPRLKLLLGLIFATFAVLGATGAYLTSIRLLDLFSGQTYTTPFKYWMLLGHVAVGLVMLAPFLVFGIVHWKSAYGRSNRRAVKLGIVLFFIGVLVCASGLALIRLDGMPQLRTDSKSHLVVLVLHIALPFLAALVYVLHRRAGPDIQWKWGYYWAAGVGLFCVGMLYMHGQDPRKWNQVGSPEGLAYYHPSAARTADGNFIPAEVMLMDKYCLKCHEDVYDDHLHSAHRFSSFNNPAYLASVRETREVGMKRDGNVKASRWCAGCHDAVPFFSGVFEDPRTDPKYDAQRDAERLQRFLEVEDVIAGRKHALDSPIAGAGVTCTVCHAITNVNSTIGNGDFTIEQPLHYPFAFSDNSWLQWINNQLVKAEPSFHKKTFLKPLHKTAELCSTCHKVSLPVELNHYKEFLRGQNHYDSYLLSGVSGHGARAFYYPPKAKQNCAECHMPTYPSADLGSKDFDGDGVLKRHSHRFPAANTGLFDILKNDSRYESFRGGFDTTIKAHADYLRGIDAEGKDKKVRIDLFGIKDGATIDGPLTVLRPALPKLKPGQSYLVEVVIRTLAVGHPLTQGTVDSNEVWVDFAARAGGRTIARNGALSNSDDTGEVDRWAHYINVHMLDRNGNRINRRNPQDIFTPLYDHQIPPGAAAVVHYHLDVPADVTGPVELKVCLRYRKFDEEFMRFVRDGKAIAQMPKLTIVDICEDQVTLPVVGMADAAVAAQTSPIKPAWQRWNDYGIGCYLEGGVGAKRGELKQALAAFRHLLTLDDKDAAAHGHLNSARVLIDEGRLKEATEALNKAEQAGAPWWTVAWFKGVVATENATKAEEFDVAAGYFEKIIDGINQPHDRGFDFRQDYVVLARLGLTYFKRSQLEGDRPEAERQFLLKAASAFERALAIDSEDLDSHYGLYQCFNRLGRDFAQQGAGAPAADANGLLALASSAADSNLPADRREAAIATLIRDVQVFTGKPPSATPKLPTIRALANKLRPALHAAEGDEKLRPALAQALAILHRELHAIYRPDEVARGRTVREYRAKNPAANHAAEAIVIYPTTEAQIAELRNRKGDAGGD